MYLHHLSVEHGGLEGTTVGVTGEDWESSGWWVRGGGE